MEPAVDHTSDLTSFIDFLYDGLEGYAYLAAKEPGAPDNEWLQQFFAMPAERSKLEATIEAANKQYEIFLSPALFDAKSSKREHIKVTNVIWTEFDGNAPEEYGELPQPSVVVQSSSESHLHVYWKLNEPLQGSDAIESFTKKVTYAFSADASAWDANQVLRPPATFNHKRGMDVTLKSRTSLRYDNSIFNPLPEPPEDSSIVQWEVSALPDLQDVMLRHAFPENAVQLFKKDVQVGERSSALMNLAYSLAEATDMSDVEMFVVVKAADEMWGKFKKRRDRDRRLAQIVSIARQKYPAPTQLVQLGSEAEQAVNDDEFHQTFALDYVTFLKVEVEFDWVVEGMLMDQGNMLMAGPSGIGKTQLSLEFMKHIALGKDYLHYKIPTAKKIVMLSLEMGLPDLQYFMRKQDAILNADEREILRENLIIIPHGESWPLNTIQGQDQLNRVLDHFGPEGLFVDSVGSAILGDLNSQKIVQEFVNYNDRIRKQYGLFLWYIHHTRKPAPGQKTSDQSDVYGDQYLVNRATSSYGVLKAKNGLIRIRNFKNRLAKQEDDYFINRIGESLTFVEAEKESASVFNQENLNDDDGPTSPDSTAGPFAL